MDRVIYISKLDIEVTARKVETEHGYRWIIEPNIWHPSIYFIGSFSVQQDFAFLFEELTKMDTTEPLNIGAHIQYRKYKKLFFEYNKRVKDIYLDEYKECCICLEQIKTNENIRFTCYMFHWACESCFYKIRNKRCPLCRRFMFTDPSKILK